MKKVAYTLALFGLLAAFFFGSTLALKAAENAKAHSARSNLACYR